MIEEEKSQVKLQEKRQDLLDVQELHVLAVLAEKEALTPDEICMRSERTAAQVLVHYRGGILSAVPNR